MKSSQFSRWIRNSSAVLVVSLVFVAMGWAQAKPGKAKTNKSADDEIASATLTSGHSEVSDAKSSDDGAAANAPEYKPIEGTPAVKPGPASEDPDYVIGPQDLLAINVWHEPELSRSVPVRPDGKISLPLVGEFSVSGLTPRSLESHLAKELENYVRYPQVTVMIQEANSHKFYIIGQIDRPGAYPLTSRMTILNALATAGGFRDFAKVQHIYLLRPMPDGSRKRMPFDYKAVVGGKNLGQDIELQTGDTVVVP